jgi:hypothetical protein
MVDEAAFPACLLDSRWRYLHANAGWEASLQKDRFRLGEQEIVLDGRGFLQDVPAERRERWADALKAIVAGRLGHFLDETVERRSTGERVVVTTASPWIGPDGRVDGVLCLRYDLTDARRGAANESALTDVLMVSRRLQHFLGNQIALTLGYVELLTTDTRLPPDLRERVDEALRGVVEATDTLSKLRSLTRLELAPDDPSVTAEHPEHDEHLD